MILRIPNLPSLREANIVNQVMINITCVVALVPVSLQFHF